MRACYALGCGLRTGFCLGSGSARLGSAGTAAEHPGRQRQDRVEQREDAVDSDSEQTERQQYEPDEGIGDQSDQRQRPADDEKEQPEEELGHVWPYGPTGLRVSLVLRRSLAVLDSAALLWKATVGHNHRMMDDDVAATDSPAASDDGAARERHLGEYRLCGPLVGWGEELAAPLLRAEHVLSRQQVVLGVFDRDGHDPVSEPPRPGGGDRSLPDATQRRRTALWDRALRISHVDHHALAELVESRSPDQPRPFLAWHLDSGRTLRERVGSPHAPGAGRALQPVESLRLVAQLAEGLEALHRAEELHGGLCPANVLLRPGGAQMLSPGWGPFNARSALQDATEADDGCDPGSVAGWLYRAPEQLPGGRGPIGPAVDLWALGAILFELLARRPLGWRTTLSEDGLQATTLEQWLPALEQPDALELELAPVVAGLPAPAAAVLEALLRFRPSDRPRAGELAAPLNEAIATLSPKVVSRQPRSGPAARPAPSATEMTGPAVAGSSLAARGDGPRIDDWRGSATWLGERRRELAEEEDDTPLWLIWAVPFVGLLLILAMVVLALTVL